MLRWFLWGKTDKPAGRQILTGTGRQMWKDETASDCEESGGERTLRYKCHGGLGHFSTLEQVRLTSSRPGSKVANWNARSGQGYVNLSLKPYSSLPLWHPFDCHFHLQLTLPACLSACLLAKESNSQRVWMNLLFHYYVPVLAPLHHRATSCFNLRCANYDNSI